MSKILEKIDTERLVSDAHYLEEYIRFLLTNKENWATDFTISQQYKAVWFLDWNFHNIHRRVGILVFFEGHAKVLWTERTIWGFKECLGIFEAFVKPMYNTFLDIADLVKEELSVNSVFADRLKELSVPFTAKGDVNTNSLKSWLSEQLGLKAGSVSRMNYEDIPDFVNFYRYNTTVVSKPKL